MNRERAKKLLPIIEAFADGKEIECYSELGDRWLDISEPAWQDTVKYRIKPDPQYRPFNCGELQRIVGKVVKYIDGSVSMITGAYKERVSCEGRTISASGLLENYVFVDTGDKCGVKLVQ